MLLTFSSLWTPTAPRNLHIPKEMKAQYFKFSPKIINSNLNRAHLWVHVKNHRDESSSGSQAGGDDDDAEEEPRDQGFGRRNNNNNQRSKKEAWLVVYKLSRQNNNNQDNLDFNNTTPTLLHVRAHFVYYFVNERGGKERTNTTINLM